MQINCDYRHWRSQPHRSLFSNSAYIIIMLNNPDHSVINSMKFHHVGVGTTSFEEAIAVYQKLGYQLICSMDDDVLDLRVAFLQKDGSPFLEIIAPLGPDGPLKSFLNRRIFPSPYHTCYATDNIHEAGACLQELGFFPLGEPKPSRALNGALFAFHYHNATGLIELAESPTIWMQDIEQIAQAL